MKYEVQDSKRFDSEKETEYNGHRVSYDEAFDALDIAEERYSVYLEKIGQKE